MRSEVFRVLAAVCAFTGCLPDADMKIAYNDTPRQRGDGWEISTPEAEGVDPIRLRTVYEQFFDEDRFVTGISLLVIRHGRLVAEGYCRDLDDIDRLNAIQSATKSVTSMLAGMVIGDGGLEGPEQLVFDVIPESFDGDPEKRDLTIDDLLTMRTGIDFPNEAYSRELLIDGHSDSLAYILQKPRVREPGTDFDYIDASPHLLAGVLQRALGTTLEDYAKERLFGPLGIDHILWERYQDGITYGAVGLYLEPRDLGKLGQLMLEQGFWNGEQIVPPDWVAESTAIHVGPESGLDHWHYGYYWWVIDEIDAYTADGHGGQFSLVVPDRDLVVVMTAEPHTKNGVAAIELDQFIPLATEIVEALVD